MTMNTGQKHEDSNYDSETESESEDYEHTYAMEATQYLQQSAARSRSTNTDKGPEECFMEVQGAVTDLLSVELSCIVDVCARLGSLRIVNFTESRNLRRMKSFSVPPTQSWASSIVLRRQ